jgi:hypothetical protein
MMVLGIAASAVACVTFGTSEPDGVPSAAAPPPSTTSPTAPVAPAPSSPAGAAPSAGSTPGDDAGTAAPLLANGGFETGSAPGTECLPGWTLGLSATADRVDAHPHAGAYACRVCNTVTKGFVVAQKIVTAGPGTYLARAYVRAEGAPVGALLQLWISHADGTSEYPLAVEAPPADGSYIPLELSYVADASVTTIEVHAGAGTEQTGCIVIDDVSLVRLP